MKGLVCLLVLLVGLPAASSALDDPRDAIVASIVSEDIETFAGAIGESFERTFGFGAMPSFETLVIGWVVKGSPAWHAGMRPGMSIVYVGTHRALEDAAAQALRSDRTFIAFRKPDDPEHLYGALLTRRAMRCTGRVARMLEAMTAEDVLQSPEVRDVVSEVQNAPPDEALARGLGRLGFDLDESEISLLREVIVVEQISIGKILYEAGEHLFFSCRVAM